MRLLPRSRRGTWLLGGAVWCAACVGLWWRVTPGVPRAVMQLDERVYFVGFGPGGASALLVSDESDNSGQQKFSLRLVEVPTGAELAKLYTNDAALEFWTGSPDGRIWLFKSGITCFKVDVVHRKVIPLDVSGADVFQLLTLGMTTDGRFCFFLSNDMDGRRTHIVDLERNQVYRQLANKCWPDGLDVHGNQIILSWRENRLLVSLTDPVTLDERACYWIELDLLVSESAGQLNDEPRVIRDLVMLMNVNRLRVLDAATLQLRFQIPEPVDYAVLSPDGRLLTAATWPRETTLEWCLKQVGLSAIFPKNADVPFRLFSTETGAELHPNLIAPEADLECLFWLPGQSAVAIRPHDRQRGLQIWDIPPRKSLTWFVAGAALLALPIALMAWWRSRKLRAA